MRNFKFYWKEHLIGFLSINKSNDYKFLLENKNLETACLQGLPKILIPKEQTEFGTPIPFFEKRLMNYSDDTIVYKYHTDFFKLVKESE